MKVKETIFTKEQFAEFINSVECQVPIHAEVVADSTAVRKDCQYVFDGWNAPFLIPFDEADELIKSAVRSALQRVSKQAKGMGASMTVYVAAELFKMPDYKNAEFTRAYPLLFIKLEKIAEK